MVDEQAFRAALGRFVSGVTVVTTRSQGIDHAMTASAFTSVSLDPPQVLLGVHVINRFHDAVIDSGRWAVSILSQSAEPAATNFAKRGRDLLTQFDSVEHERTESGLIRIHPALAWLDCETVQVVTAGDHSMLIGAVISAEVNEDHNDPLVYYRSHYGGLIPSNRSEKDG